MVVADDHVNPLGLGIVNFLVRFNAAVEGNDKPEAAVARPVYTLVRQTITFVIAVRNIEIHFLGISPKEGIHQSHSRGPVHIVVTIYEDFLLGSDGPADPLNSRIHVFHQEWIMEILETGTEERASLFEGFDPPLDKQFGKDAVNTELGGESPHLLRIRRIFDYPLALFRHIRQR